MALELGRSVFMPRSCTLNSEENLWECTYLLPPHETQGWNSVVKPERRLSPYSPCWREIR
ncbi:hypothetical protein LEMLEM_LOCUS27278 [Lemmus lemmus]